MMGYYIILQTRSIWRYTGIVRGFRRSRRANCANEKV